MVFALLCNTGKNVKYDIHLQAAAETPCCTKHVFTPLTLQELDETEVMAKPNVFCHFARGIGEPRYLPIKSWVDLNAILQDALTTYNELNAAMNLVLFEDAMAHVCRWGKKIVLVIWSADDE